MTKGSSIRLFLFQLSCLSAMSLLSLSAGASPGGSTGVSARVLSPDRIRLVRGGRVLFQGSLPLRLRGARMDAVFPFSFHKMPALRVRLRQSDGFVELVLVRRAGRWELVWAGRTGPLGPDGDVERVVETGPSRVLVYETKRGLRRCDQSRVRLFPRAFDPKTWRMRPVSLRPDTSGVEVIEATSRPPGNLSWPAGLSAMKFVAASTVQADGGRAKFLGRPRGIDDGDLSTMWAEARGGAGVGEFLDARSPSWPYELVGLVVVPGNALSPQALARDNRVARFLLSFGKDRQFVIHVPDPVRSGRFPPVYWVLFPKPVRARCATLVLLSAYPGTDARAGGRTAVSELRFLSRLDFKGGIGRLAQDVAEGRVDRALALSVLRRLGKAALPGMRAALARSKGAVADVLAMAFLELAPDHVGEIAGRVASLSLPVRRRFALAAGRYGDRDLLRRFLSDRTNERVGWLVLETAWRAGRRRAVARVAADLLDRVSDETARKLAGILIDTRATELPQSAVLGSSPSALRVWAAGQRVLAGVAPCGVTAGRLLALWKRARTFELRFRIVQALGWCLASPGGRVGAKDWRREATALLRDVIQRNREELLRWAAVRAAGAKGLGVDILRSHLSDAAPRVRVAAIKGLVRSGWAGRGRALLRCTLQDPWDWVRLECSSMLARVCPRGIGGVLAGQVRRYGLAATTDLATVLATCRYREAWPLLKGFLSNSHKGPWKAARAAALLGAARRVDAIDQMVDLLRRFAPKAKIHGPFERLSLALLGALDEMAGVVHGRNEKLLWSGVAVVLRRGATKPVRARAVELVARHCPAGWRRMLKAGADGQDMNVVGRLRASCGGGAKAP